MFVDFVCVSQTEGMEKTIIVPGIWQTQVKTPNREHSIALHTKYHPGQTTDSTKVEDFLF